MDAATLYVIVTMSDGTQSTSTFGFRSLRDCAAGMEVYKEMARADSQGPVSGFCCAENRQTVILDTCEWRYRGCEQFTMSSLQGCNTLKWVIRMRKPGRAADCYMGERKLTDDNRWQPDPIDGNDILKRR